MKLLGSLIRSCVLVSWLLATLSSCQGGSYGWIPGFVNQAGSCNVTSPLLANYVGCVNIGQNATAAPFIVRNNQTNITYGTGWFMPPFALANQGAASFPGMPLNGNSTWTSMETSYNCTLACRAHGMKYSLMMINTCNCSPYLNISIFLGYNTNPPTVDAVYMPLYGYSNSCCSVQSQGGYFGAYGDNLQTNSGWYVSLQFDYMIGRTVFPYAYGLLAATTFVDTTFASDSTLNYTFQATNYGYLGCFILSSSSTSFMPLGFSNNFSTPSQCYAFCANINMPYAGMAYQGGIL
jgi:hypothetical protein